jgi:hypothetical protein
MTDNTISKSAASEVSIKLKGKDDGLGDDGSDVDVIFFIIPDLIVINLILQLFSYCILLSSLQYFINSKGST